MSGYDVHCARRIFLKSVCERAALLFLPLVVSACGSRKQPDEKPSPGMTNGCDDNAMSPSLKEKRKKLGYVRVSPMDNMTCSVCALWKAPQNGLTCGGCMLFDGPVQPEAYCTYWAAKKQAAAK